MAGKVGNEARSGELTRELDEDDEVFRGFLMKNHLGEMVSILEASDPTLFYSLSIEYVGQSLVIILWDSFIITFSCCKLANFKIGLWEKLYKNPLDTLPSRGVGDKK